MAGKSLSYILVILLPPIIIFSNFYYLFFNSAYWQKLFEKTGVYQNFSRQEAQGRARNVLEFYENKNGLDKSFFSNQAVLHLTDVKRVLYLTLTYYLLLLFVSLIICVALIVKKQAKLFLQSLIIASATTTALVVTLSFGLSRGFDRAFALFHQAIFSNDLWMFTPDDNLIKLFPQEFFVQFANRLAPQIIISSALIFTLAFIAKRKKNDSA